MKRIFIVALAIAVVGCKEEPKDYATLSGTITNKNSDSLVVRTKSGYSKTIKVNDDGTFSDTLKVEAGVYNLFDGTDHTNVFLKEDVDINLTLDTKDFTESVKYAGKGSETSNYLAQKMILQKKSFNPDLLDLAEEDFKTKVAEIHQNFTELLENSTNLDSVVAATDKASYDKMEEGLLSMYQQQKAMANQYDDLVGKPSPAFVNYENFKGGTTSLSDLKGKYVYIDVWATWCGPCKKEIPFLKEVEAKYHNGNIEFVSISIDKKNDYDKWKTMVKEKELGGTQLFADNDWKSDFVKEYKIMGIPRFILIDPNGNIVDANAPRPSSPKLATLFAELKI